MSEDTEWFYEKDGAQQGPVSAKDIQQLAADGIVQPKTLLWCEGMENWLSYQSSAIYVATPASAPPAVPEQSVGSDGAKAPPPIQESSVYAPPVASQPAAPLSPAPGSSLPAPRAFRYNEDYSFSIREVLGTGWTAFAANFWPTLGFLFIAAMILGVASNFLLPVFFLTYPLLGGFMFYTVRLLRGERPTVECVFDGFRRRFGALAMLSLIISLVSIALMLFLSVGLLGAIFSFSGEIPAEYEMMGQIGSIVGGVIGLILIPVIFIVSFNCFIATLLCLDCDLGFREAYSAAWRAFRRRPWKVLLFMLVAGLISYGGVLALYFGVFVTGTWMYVCYGAIYEKAFGDEKPALPSA